MSDLDWDHGLAMLDSFIADCIANQATRQTRRKLRRYIDAGMFLVRTRFTVVDDEPDPFSLVYIVSIPVREPDDQEAIGWDDVMTVHWSRLELTPDHVAFELAATLRQHAANDGTVTVSRSPLAGPPPFLNSPPDDPSAPSTEDPV